MTDLLAPTTFANYINIRRSAHAESSILTPLSYSPTTYEEILGLGGYIVHIIHHNVEQWSTKEFQSVAEIVEKGIQDKLNV